MRPLLALLGLSLAGPAAAADRPNVIVVLADDLGYGDVKCLNPDGKIPTPHLDRLAAQGMTFTDAHSPSAVCSPTRYGLLTGRYAWRSRLKSGVLGGLSPRLIEPGRLTVAQLLKQHGYHTAAVGKWHLGMDWQLKPGKQVTELNIEPREQVFNVEYDRPIANGPNSVGFDYYFGISASLDMVPYTFIENDRVTVSPTEDRDFPLMLGKETGGRCRQGPAAPGFDAADVLPTLTKKATDTIAGRAKPGTRHDGIVCLTDILATCADAVGAKLPAAAGEDSVSLLPALGVGKGLPREAIVVHSINGSFAVREGRWKLCLCPGSGGWIAPRPGRDDASQLPPVQLFDLTADIGEKTNLQDRHPEVVSRLTRRLEKYVSDGRSTPGEPQKNTTPVDVWKAGKEAMTPPRKK